MPVPICTNFDLLITRAGERYRACVVDALARADSALFNLPKVSQ
jgi:hypothetical protein